MARGKHEKPTFAELEKRREKKQIRRGKKLEYSKRLTNDMRYLLWVISVGALLLAFFCAYLRFEAAFPWITAMVGLPWTAWGTAAAFYLNLAKSDHKAGGITYDAAKAVNFRIESDDSGSKDSPAI